MTKLTQHFTEAEFLRSATALRRGILNVWAHKEHKKNAIAVCKILEKIRTTWQRPLIITSGYRSQTLNKVLGGAKYSKHLTGRAVDFYIPGVNLGLIYTAMKDHDGGLAISHAGHFIHIDTGAKRRWKY